METPISTRAALIQALDAEPGYGLELIDRVQRATGLHLHQGSVYPALVSLEEEGLIRRSRTREGAGRACCYEITRKGARLAEEHREVVGKLFAGRLGGRGEPADEVKAA